MKRKEKSPKVLFFDKMILSLQNGSAYDSTEIGLIKGGGGGVGKKAMTGWIIFNFQLGLWVSSISVTFIRKYWTTFSKSIYLFICKHLLSPLYQKNFFCGSFQNAYNEKNINKIRPGKLYMYFLNIKEKRES